MMTLFADKLENIKSGIVAELPPEMFKTVMRRNMFPHLTGGKKESEITTCPVLDSLSDFISEIQTFAKNLANSDAK